MRFELYPDPNNLKPALILNPWEFRVVRNILEPILLKNIPKKSNPHPFSYLADHLVSASFNVEEPKRLLLDSSGYKPFMDIMYDLALDRICSLLDFRRVLTSEPMLLGLDSFPDDKDNYDTGGIVIDEIMSVEIAMLDKEILKTDEVASQFADTESIYFDLD